MRALESPKKGQIRPLGAIWSLGGRFYPTIYTQEPAALPGACHKSFSRRSTAFLDGRQLGDGTRAAAATRFPRAVRLLHEDRWTDWNVECHSGARRGDFLQLGAGSF